MKILNTILSFVLLFSIIGCSAQERNEADVMNVTDQAGTKIMNMTENDDVASEKHVSHYSSVPEETTDINIPERKIVKNGDLKFETKGLKDTRMKISDLIIKNRAYIFSENEYQYDDRTEIQLVCKVPVERFETFIDSISNYVDVFDSKSISTQDVSAEFYDLEARLKTQKEIEQRFLQLLDKAKNMDEIYNLERQIGDIRYKIESYEGRLKQMRHQTSYSTLSINMYQKVRQPKGFSDKFAEGFQAGWDSFVWIFIGLSNVWVYLLIFMALVIYFRLHMKKSKVSDNKVKANE